MEKKKLKRIPVKEERLNEKNVGVWKAMEGEKKIGPQIDL